jgi:hypothetical protein
LRISKIQLSDLFQFRLFKIILRIFDRASESWDQPITRPQFTQENATEEKPADIHLFTFHGSLHG